MNTKFVRRISVFFLIALASLYIVDQMPAKPVKALTTFTTSTTIAAGNVTFDNDDIICDGTAGGVVLTIDGPHTFNSLQLINGCTLNHSDTTTATVYTLDLTITNNVTIDATSSINVTGLGFEGGINAASGRSWSIGNVTTFGSTGSAGGAHGGLGGFGGNGGVTGKGFGDLTNPSLPGGGGGGWDSNSFHHGGDGGGVIRFSVGGSFSHNGTIVAEGTTGSGGAAGAGAGGSVYINAATISGSGSISVNGGPGILSANQEGGGGGGRIALVADTISHSGTVTAYGGTGSNGGGYGGAGTIFRKLTSQTHGDVEVNNVSSTTDWRTPHPFTIWTGTSTGLSATVLTDTGASFTAGELVGLHLNPNANQMTSFVITANTATTITVTGDLTTVAASGNAYAVARPQFDNVTFSGDSYTALDDFVFTATNVFMQDSAILTHVDYSTVHASKLEFNTTNFDQDAGTLVEVTGRGFFGGSTAGSGAGYTTGNTTAGGSTGASGGSHGGRGGNIGNGGVPASAYDSLTDPSEPGGGGGGWDTNGGNRGGDGGGVIRIFGTGTATLDGEIRTNGLIGSGGAGGGGAGGAILVNFSLGIIEGTGTFNANGGNGAVSANPESGGGGGRIAVFYTTDNSTLTYNAYGGTGSNGGEEGGAGTIYLKGASQANGDLITDNNDRVTYDESTPLPAVPVIFDNVTIRNDARVMSDNPLSEVVGTMLLDDGWYNMKTTDHQLQVQTLTLQNGANLTHSETTTSDIYRLNILVTGDMNIDGASTINVNGRGFSGGVTNGSGQAWSIGNVVTFGSTGSAGGAHGGRGGFGGNGGLTGKVFDDPYNPNLPGGGGGGWDTNGGNRGGDGGGVIRLTVNGTFAHNGVIEAIGSVGSGGAGGAGAGGSVYINTGTLAGSGSISVNGGPGITSANIEGGGGGGRIAIFSTSFTHTGSLTAHGGTGSNGGGYGGAGTIVKKLASQTYGDLIVDNGNTTAEWRTATPYRMFQRTSTGLTATILTDASAAFTPDALIGLTLNPNRSQMTTFTITDNDATTITVTGDMTSVAASGNTYVVGRTTWDNMTFSGESWTAIDDMPFTTTNLTVTDNAILTHEDIFAGHLSKLEATTTNLTIDSNARIDASGRGFLGGSTAGSGAGYTTGNTTAGGSTGATGGSHGGRGGNVSGAGGTPAVTFDSITNPSEPGGGGGGWDTNGGNRGGDGGGVIRIFGSGSFTINGEIRANGLVGSGGAGGGGAGGTILLQNTTGSLSGSGTLSANGGVGATSANVESGGGGGRIAVFYTTDSSSWTYNAYGENGTNGGEDGGAGTTYLKSASQPNGDLIIDNDNNVSYDESTTLPASPTIFDSVTIRKDARVVSSSSLEDVVGTMLLDDGWYSMGTTDLELEVEDLILQNGANMTHSLTTTSQINRLKVLVNDDMSIDGTSTVNVDGRGFNGGSSAAPSGRAYSVGNTTATGSDGARGGSHGGFGGLGNHGGLGKTFGDLTNPNLPGGGGGGWDTNGLLRGGNGGGVVRFTVSDEFAHNGTITAEGVIGSGGAGAGGAGGSVYVNAGTFTGSGSISTDGGDGSASGNNEGAGGGGRIAIHAGTNTHTGALSAHGGSVNIGSGRGGGGTIFKKLTSQTYGDIVMDNNVSTVDWLTPSPFEILDGTSTGLTATVLTDTGASFEVDSLIGLTLNPNDTQMTTFTITDNDATTITVSGDMTTVATSGNAYIIARSQFDTITLRGQAHVAVDDTTFTVSDLLIEDTAVLTHIDHVGGVSVSKLEFTATNLTVESTGQINLTGRGYNGGSSASPSGAAYTSGNSLTGGSNGATGGSHGGQGGQGNHGTIGASYGSFKDPVEPGAGGGGWDTNGLLRGGDGGGLLRAFVSGLATIDGSILADGAIGSGGAGGGGAGGGIMIDATGGTITGTGTISANGGAGAASGNNEGAGGGGRVALIYDTNTFTGTTRAYGGTINVGTSEGAAGTVYLKDANETHGDYIANNNNLDTTSLTYFFIPGENTQETLRNLSVLNLAKLAVDSPGTCGASNAITITGSIDISNSGQIINNLSGSCPLALPSLAVGTSSLPAAPLNGSYSTTLMAVGGYAPFSWSCVADAACASSLPTGLSLNTSTGEISGTATQLGVFPLDVEVTDNDPGGATTNNRNLNLVVGNAPDAPTSHFTDNTDAQSGSLNPVNISDVTPIVSAVFSDTDVADTATHYQVQVATDTGFTNILWDSGMAAFSTACTNGARCENITIGTSLALDGAIRYWRIRFFDQLGLIGPWTTDPSTESTFTMFLPTNPLDITAPKVENAVNPPLVFVERPKFKATFNDNDSSVSDQALSARIQVATDAGFTSLVWDSGHIALSSACDIGAVCSQIEYGAASELAFDGTQYFWRMYFIDSFGLSGTFDSIGSTFTMANLNELSPRISAGGGGGGSGSGSGSGASSTSSSTGATSTPTTTPTTSTPEEESLSPAAEPPVETPEEEEVEEIPTLAPVAAELVPYPLSSNTIRWYIRDNSDNESGFRIVDEQGTIVDSVDADTFYVDETGLASNTRYARRVIAFNSVGDATPSAIASINTFASTPDGLELRYVTFENAVVNVQGVIEVEQSASSQPSWFDGLFAHVFAAEDPEEVFLEDIIQDYEGKTAYFYENLTTGEVSGWIKETGYEFKDLRPNTQYAVRVKTRNADGYQTSYTVPLSLQTLSTNMPVVEMELTVGINQGLNGGPGSFDHDGDRTYIGDELTYLLEYCHVSGDAATGVTISNPIHPYFLYRQSTGGEFRNGLFQFDVGRIEPGTCGFVGYLVEISTDTPAPGLIMNQAALDSLDLPGTVISNVTANPIGNYVILRRPPKPLPQPPRGAIHSSSQIRQRGSTPSGYSGGGGYSSSYRSVSRPPIPVLPPPQNFSHVRVAYQLRSAFGLVFISFAPNVGNVSSPPESPPPGTTTEGPPNPGDSPIPDPPDPNIPPEDSPPPTDFPRPDERPEDPVIPASVCGNSRVEIGEQCDDGNLRSNDGCSDTCQIDEVIPDPELIVLDVAPATRDRGFVVTYQVIGMTDGDIELRREGVELDVLLRSTFVSHVENTLEVPVSVVRGMQSFNFSRIFHEVSRIKKLSDFQYNRIFKKAIEESSFSFTLRAIEGEKQAQDTFMLEIDNVPPVTSIDTPEGEYFEPFNVNITSNE